MKSVSLQNIKPGQSILEIFLKNDIGLHYNCGGVCSCTTCHLYIDSGEEHLEEISRREVDFLKRAVHAGPNSRLGCQCLIVNDHGELAITIPDQTML